MSCFWWCITSNWSHTAKTRTRKPKYGHNEPQVSVCGSSDKDPWFLGFWRLSLQH